MSQELTSNVGPTQDERTMATLAQVLQLVGSWIAPLIILIVRRQSSFVSFHALQALLLQTLYMFVMIFCVFGFFVFGLTGFLASSRTSGEPPVAFFFLFPVIWLVMMGFGLLMIVTGIVYGIKAGRGEWAESPVLGGLARRILKLGPGGTPLPVSS